MARIFKSAYRGGYDLPVEIWLRTEDRREVAEARHKLAAALWTDEPAALYLPDDPTRYLLAIVSGSTDLDEITDDCPTTTVTFHIGDPDYYGQRRRMEVSAGNIYVNAGGNRPAYLKVTARPSRWQHVADYATSIPASSWLSTPRLRLRAPYGLTWRPSATVNNQTAPVTIDSDYFEINGRCHLEHHQRHRDS